MPNLPVALSSSEKIWFLVLVGWLHMRINKPCAKSSHGMRVGLDRQGLVHLYLDSPLHHSWPANRPCNVVIKKSSL